MKLNLSLTKVIIKLIILLIIIVMLCIISAFLYSAKYWSDVYNYINANITIKRIPTITEIENLTIYDDTTDIYGTTDIYETTDSSTTGVTFVDGDYFSLDDVENERERRQVKVESLDYSEIPQNDVLVEYFFDVIDVNKLTTADMEDVEMIPGGEFNSRLSKLKVDEKCANNTDDVTKTVFPWIAAIFIRNETSNQFDYYCDGALLSETIIITAAQCVQNVSSSVEDLIVLLGKRSLRTMSDYEKVIKVKEIIIHENFTEYSNDIAVLVIEMVELSDTIQTACLGNVEDYEESATTGWAISGEMTMIPFEKEKSCSCEECRGNTTFCSVYGDNVTVCPSYGGIHVARHTNAWYLHAIRSADPTDRGICYDRTVYYTPLGQYIDWIRKYVK